LRNCFFLIYYPRSLEVHRNKFSSAYPVCMNNAQYAHLIPNSFLTNGTKDILGFVVLIFLSVLKINCIRSVWEVLWKTWM